MTIDYAQAETSIENGMPVRLYLFRCENLSWSYTSGDTPITFEPELFFASIFIPPKGGISDSGIRQTGQPSADTLKIKIGAKEPLVQLCLKNPPAQEIEVILYGRHLTACGDDEYVRLWSGQIGSVRLIDSLQAELSCTVLTSRMQSTGLRLCWTRSCPHIFLSPECGVDKKTVQLVSIVEDLDSKKITCSALAALGSRALGGYCEWEADNLLYRRTIEQHYGSQIWLLGGTHGILLGQTINIYFGCPKNLKNCLNPANYGGFVGLPDKNPFEYTPF